MQLSLCMYSYRHFIALILLTLFFIALPVAVNATGPAGGGGGGGNVPKIENPLKCAGCNDLAGLLIAIVEEVAKVGFYLVVFFIIYSGFLFVAARGDTTKLGKAKATFLYTVIGAAILLGATILANVIQGTVNQLQTKNDQATLIT